MNPVSPSPAAALLARLRFEQEMGIEFLGYSPPPAVPAPGAGGADRSGAAAVPAAAVQSGGAAPSLFGSAEPLPPPRGSAAPEHEGRWTKLEECIRGCTKCPLHQTRTQAVPGEGSHQAQLVFVGEGPGADEDASGRPFVGRAGQLLDKIIAAMGLQRREVYICNVVKCRPPENRAPLPDEIAACRPYLEEQLELLKPRVIVALGSPAAKTLLQTTEGITKLRGHWHAYRGLRVMPTYHPAFVLRQYTPQVRGEVWSDMQQVTAVLKASGQA